MAEHIVTYRGTVYPWHCDQMGHMNVMWYVGKFDEATWQLFSAAGITPSYLRSQRRGMVAVDQRLSYRGELYAGDVISVRSAIIELGTSSVRFVHEMQRDETGEHVATSMLKGVHIDTVARRSCPLPEEQRVAACRLVVADASAWEGWPPPALSSADGSETVMLTAGDSGQDERCSRGAARRGAARCRARNE
jgi:acyl-CoA thioester hydrolase